MTAWHCKNFIEIRWELTRYEFSTPLPHKKRHAKPFINRKLLFIAPSRKKWHFNVTPTRKVAIWRYLPFWPLNVQCLQNEHRQIAYDPTFYFRILPYSKNVDVCKKLELNPSRFDRDIRVLSQKKIFSKIFICSPCKRKTP